MAQLEGVDVSHNNGEINWERVRDAGIAFALIKATEGSTFVDPRGLANRAKCRKVGITPAMYHFYRHDVDPGVQAAHFLQHIGSHEPGDLLPAVDVEAPADGAGPITYPKTEVVNRIGVFVRAVRAAIGRAPMIYTYPSAWQEVTKNSNAFAGTYPLWIASYGGPAPAIIGGWTDYTVWQYTDHGKVKGIGGGVDRNRFNGSEAQLAALCIGTLMNGGKAILNQDGNVRQARGLSSYIIRALPRGTRVTIVAGPEQANGRDWWQIDDGAGAAGWCSSKVLSPA